jgi:SAM-dependent methyltransferase
MNKIDSVNAMRLDASMFEPVSCYACGSAHSTPFIEAVDDLTGRPGRFTFVRCSTCDLVYQSPRLTLEHIRSYYDSGYIAHQKRNRWGPLSPLFNAAMDSLDRAKLRIVDRYVPLTQASAVLDVGCATGSFLAKVRDQRGPAVVGVDFVDLSHRPTLRGAEFHHGLFYDQEVGRERFDLVTMWHFLEHDYDPMRSLAHARQALKPDGRLVIEVPRLDSLTYRMFKDRWPGLQAPQHTAVYDRRASCQSSCDRGSHRGGLLAMRRAFRRILPVCGGGVSPAQGVGSISTRPSTSISRAS